MLNAEARRVVESGAPAHLATINLPTWPPSMGTAPLRCPSFLVLHVRFRGAYRRIARANRH